MKAGALLKSNKVVSEFVDGTRDLAELPAWLNEKADEDCGRCGDGMTRGEALGGLCEGCAVESSGISDCTCKLYEPGITYSNGWHLVMQDDGMLAAKARCPDYWRRKGMVVIPDGTGRLVGLREQTLEEKRLAGMW